MRSQKEYQQVLAPDCSRIAEIILAARGEERTMVQFAEITGINTATLSRLLNGKMKRPLTVNVINAVMDHKSPSCEFSKEDMFRANGMVDSDTYERRYRNARPRDKKQIRNERVAIMKKIIVNELYNRNVAFKKEDPNELKEVPALTEFAASGSRELLRLMENSKTKYWGLVFNALLSSDAPDDNPYASEPFRRRILAYYASVFLADAWQPETMAGLKTSFVFCDEGMYDLFRSVLKNARINSNMTMILLDLLEERVIREELVPGCKMTYKQDCCFNILINKTDTADDDTEELLYGPLDE